MKKMFSLFLVLIIIAFSMVGALAVAPYDELASGTYGMKINIAEDNAGIITVTHTIVGPVTGLSGYSSYASYNSNKVTLLKSDKLTEVKASVSTSSLGDLSSIMAYVDCVAVKAASAELLFSKSGTNIITFNASNALSSSIMWGVGTSDGKVGIAGNAELVVAKLYFKRNQDVTGALDDTFITFDNAAPASTKFACAEDSAVDLKNDTARFYISYTPLKAAKAVETTVALDAKTILEEDAAAPLTFGGTIADIATGSVSEVGVAINNARLPAGGSVGAAGEVGKTNLATKGGKFSIVISGFNNATHFKSGNSYNISTYYIDDDGEHLDTDGSYTYQP